MVRALLFSAEASTPTREERYEVVRS